MNVDDMTDEEFIDYCRNGGELSGLITERHPKCDWRWHVPGRQGWHVPELSCQGTAANRPRVCAASA